jgi:hypothetical protein
MNRIHSLQQQVLMLKTMTMEIQKELSAIINEKSIEIETLGHGTIRYTFTGELNLDSIKTHIENEVGIKSSNITLFDTSTGGDATPTTTDYLAIFSSPSQKVQELGGNVVELAEHIKTGDRLHITTGWGLRYSPDRRGSTQKYIYVNGIRQDVGCVKVALDPVVYIVIKATAKMARFINMNTGEIHTKKIRYDEEFNYAYITHNNYKFIVRPSNYNSEKDNYLVY